MIQTITVHVTPEVAAHEFRLKQVISQKASVPQHEIHEIQIVKRSYDARTRNVVCNVEVLFACKQTKHLPKPSYEFHHRDVSNAPTVHIVGAGPAGLFAALRFIELGFKPILLERGKSISERKRDIAALQQKHELHVDSNYCYGEGGAGTFSDGKLYTRSKKKGDNRRVLELFVAHGASHTILVDAHPHVGTDKLPDVIQNIRNTILSCGGEVHFETKVEKFVLQGNVVKALETNKGRIEVERVLLATGHSARNIYYALHDAGVELQAKPCAMGVRAEHPQELINTIQYHGNTSPYLPAASYSLAHQVQERGVYSFCMCPGGIIVPSATEPHQMVVNGMSNSQRNSPFANSGIAVELQVQDFGEFQEYGALAGLKYQEHIEKLAYNNGGRGQVAPAQRISDFVRGRISQSLPESSYIPGLVSSPLHFWLPEHISFRLQEGFKAFSRKMKGYITDDAIIVGVESRTSSPVRIPRNDNMQHIRIENLFPCGEGAGYAGGIVSSAIDGMLCADKIAQYDK